jgi:nicotinamidase-related amidase
MSSKKDFLLAHAQALHNIMRNYQQYNLYALNYRTIKKNDVLFVIDVQNDFLPPHGNFAVEEGNEIIGGITRLIDRFNKADANIILTREYHPSNHISFLPKGPFPPHCVWGQEGSRISDQLAHKILSLSHQEHIKVAFKALNEQIDSYGALPYSWEYGHNRLSGCKENNCDWTGAIIFQNLCLEKALLDYPEKYNLLDGVQQATSLQHFGVISSSIPLTEYLRQIIDDDSNIYICGLAGDFCVLDTAINLKQFKSTINVNVIYNRVRYVYEAERGYFLTPIEELVGKHIKYQINLIWSSYIEGNHQKCIEKFTIKR